MIAKQCLAHKVDMVTASYVSPALKVRCVGGGGVGGGGEGEERGDELR